MSQDMEALYQARLRRFVTALNNRKPDRVPIRPLAAEFTGRHACYTCQQLTQHYPDAFEAMIRCAVDYDWDAVPASMVYVWTGITDAATVTYYGVPGVDIPPDAGRPADRRSGRLPVRGMAAACDPQHRHGGRAGDLPSQRGAGVRGDGHDRVLQCLRATRG